MQVGYVFSAVDGKQILERSHVEVEVVVDLFDYCRVLDAVEGPTI
jgi:hypothetical protein